MGRVLSEGTTDMVHALRAEVSDSGLRAFLRRAALCVCGWLTVASFDLSLFHTGEFDSEQLLRELNAAVYRSSTLRPSAIPYRSSWKGSKRA